MHKYRLLGRKGQGTFSEVLKAQCTKNNKYVAIKCMKNHFDSVEQVNRLREIQALRRLSPHPNIIKLYEVLYDRSTGRLALVFELMEMNIYELIKGRRQYVPEDKILHFMYQLVKSMDHMHRNGIFHRDIKPENILIAGDTLKLADFGSCRGIYSKQPFTEYIATRWYRAPECLLTDGYYNYKMDLWGVGCVFFEVVSLYPLFPGTNELDQIHKIHNILGTPAPELLVKMKKHSSHIDFDFPQKVGTGLVKLIPHASPEAMDLMLKLLTYNPDERISAKQALRHAYFREIRELDRKLRKAKQERSDSGRGAQASAGADEPQHDGSARGGRESAESGADSDTQLSDTQTSKKNKRDSQEETGGMLPSLGPAIAKQSMKGGTDSIGLGGSIGPPKAGGGGGGGTLPALGGGTFTTLPSLGGPLNASGQNEHQSDDDPHNRRRDREKEGLVPINPKGAYGAAR
eukprot:TRINITY_DN827_c0_g1_i1.p1 TRINITY_DN827_c0_g1~~TRINITY_DN827_c0_g1_i1.p1  ORF type:complete len:460 (+),score=147.17 TRINITY_DN827_c0_g1_i1:281-1660(+)